MPKLVSVDTFRNRFGMPDNDNVNGKIAANLDAATVHLSTLIRTNFDKSAYTDRFWVDPQEFPFTDQFVKLYLNNGFVDSAATFVIRIDSLIENLATATEHPMDNVVIDYEKGLVLLTAGPYQVYQTVYTITEETFVQVEYTAGFDTKADAYGGSVYIAVPSWLAEAAMLQANAMIEGTCEKTGGTNICNQVLPLLDGKIRFHPSALPPLI